MALKNATATLEADMTGAAGAYGLVKVTSAFTWEADMTGTASGNETQARALATLEADMTGTIAANETQARAAATIEADMTGTIAAYVLVPGSVTMSGSSTFTPKPQIGIGRVITFANGGQTYINAQPLATAHLTVQPKDTMSGSSTFSVSSKVYGQATLDGSTSVFFTAKVTSHAPPVTLSGSSGFTATPIGTVKNSIYGVSMATAYIGGSVVPIEAGTMLIKGVLGQRTTAQFTVTDNLAQWNFITGMYCVIRDSAGNRLFAGFVTDSTMTKPTGGGHTIQHAINASDSRYLVDKRVVATSYSNQSAGSIVTDIIQNQVGGEGLFICTGKNILTDALSTPISAKIPSGMSTVSAIVTRADPTNLWTGQDVWQWTPNGATTFEELLVLLADSHFADNTQYTCSFYARCLVGTPQIRYEGYESSPSTGFSAATATLSSTWQRFSVTFTTPNPIPNRGTNSLGLRIDTGSNTYSLPIQIAAIQIEQNASATAWEFGGAVTVSAGPTIVAMTINYKYAADEIDALVQTAGFMWYVDPWNRMYFQTPGTSAAPFAIVSHTHMNLDSLTVKNTSPMYRNTQYIRGINAVTSSQTETRQGDGKTRAFTFSYPMNAKPTTLTLNGVSQTIGKKGVDTGKNFYWAKGDPVIAQDPGGTLLTSSDTLLATYVGQYPSVIRLDDTGAQAVRASIEGFTTGLVEEVESIPTINSTTEGFQVAAGFLARFVPQGQQVVFDTYYSGLYQGQQATVSIAEMNIINQSMLIEEVDIQDGDPVTIYTVTAIIGPFDTNWVAFFRKLAKPPDYVDAIDQGEAGTLVIAVTDTATYPTQTATFTATVTSVPFPSGTLYPSSSQYPG